MEKLQLIPQKYKRSQEMTTNNYTPIMDNLQELNKFWDMYNLSRLNQEEIENMNRPITSNEIESVI